MKKMKRNLILGCFLIGVSEGSPASFVPLVAPATIPPGVAQSGVSTSLAFCAISFNVTLGKVSNAGSHVLQCIT